jgi:hypothetical protein
MKTDLRLTAILIFLLMAGCMETGQQQLTESKSSPNVLASDESDPNARKSTGGGSGQIYLSVTIDEQMISSDGKGAYVNGIDGISAQFNSTDGTFSLTTKNARNKNPRKLIFPEGATYAINPNLSFNYLINVLANDVHPAPYKIQDIPEGTSQIMAMRVWGSNSSGTIEFRLLFNYGIGAGYVTDQVLVNRINSTTWTVESTDSDESNPNATAALTGENNKDLKGYYSVPFKLTLTKIN